MHGQTPIFEIPRSFEGFLKLERPNCCNRPGRPKIRLGLVWIAIYTAAYQAATVSYYTKSIWKYENL